MVKTVEIDDETKAHLEELQAEIELRTGKGVTREEIVARLIETASEPWSDFVASFETATVPLSEEEKAAMDRCRFASGVETDEDDIDDILYG